jgi:hypothetical protein
MRRTNLESTKCPHSSQVSRLPNRGKNGHPLMDDTSGTRVEGSNRLVGHSSSAVQQESGQGHVAYRNYAEP